MNRYLVVLGVWIGIAYGCDPCDDCGEALVYDPTVNVVFVNQDSINQLEVIVDDNKDSITNLKSWKTDLADTISNLNDTIDALEELIDNGNTSYQTQLDYFESILDSAGVVRDSVTSYISQIQSINSDLNSLITLMENGKLQLTQVILLDNNTELVYEDSQKTFALPLLLGTVGEYGESSYEITIVDTTFNLYFSYETYESIDEARVARVRARDLTVLDNDTVSVNCTTIECISDETTITVYF